VTGTASIQKTIPGKKKGRKKFEWETEIRSLTETVKRGKKGGMKSSDKGGEE